MRRVALIAALMWGASCGAARHYLFERGTSRYTIVVPSHASPSERTAAQELQHYIKEASGVTLPISTHAASPMVHIGWTASVGAPCPGDHDQSFTYETRNGSLYIYGGNRWGTMYGVYAFLENEMGVRWYHPECTVVPQRQRLDISALHRSEAPAFSNRYLLTYDTQADPVWCAHNRLNEAYSLRTNVHGGQTSVCGMHTAMTHVDPEKHFAKHPEYYSLRDGRRQHKRGQLCLSNPKVVDIVTQSLLQTIKEKPGYWAYDVSQADNTNYCQCSSCAALAQRYGGQSGLMLWFVNQVADRVGKVYPEVRLITFAYQYTRSAPRGIVPRGNVVVRLCDYECCFRHALADSSCKHNQAFAADIKAWQKLTDQIYVWDYVTNFYSYLLPFPNHDVLQQNAAFFARHHVVGLMEEGAHNAPWGEWSALKGWMLARLLWNPNQDSGALMHEFCLAYYGKAARDVERYLDLCKRQMGDAHLVLNGERYDRVCFGKDFISQGRSILDGALRRVAGDALTEKRLSRLYAQLLFLQVSQRPVESRMDGSYQRLVDLLKADPTRIGEGFKTLEDFLKREHGLGQSNTICSVLGYPQMKPNFFQYFMWLNMKIFANFLSVRALREPSYFMHTWGQYTT